MKASVNWLNSWLAGPALSVDEIDAILTDVGFPIDAREPAPDGDTCLEVEVTSNRGDCLSHHGLARELAARTGRALNPPKLPTVHASGRRVGDALALEVRAPEVCPRFTARVIRGVRVGPSPAWLVEKLAAVGQRSISNVVDVTNYLTFEYGQPCHAFDLERLAAGPSGKPTLVVRWAGAGESLKTLDGKPRTLKPDELVVADGVRAQSLAGVIGGGDSEVSDRTRDIALEVATWDPVVVRRAARRHQIRTDASHRFERLVDPRTIDGPAMHAAALIAELGGGTVDDGMLDIGSPAQPLREIVLRPRRLAEILGIAAPARPLLERLGVEVTPGDGDTLRCRVPAWRPDLEREIDLIEEVGRLHGLDQVPVKPAVSVMVRGPQPTEQASQALTRILTGLGFYEAVTFSFISPKAAAPFLAQGLTPLSVDDARRKEEPTLRPSVIPSLLACRRANQDAGVEQPGGVRLFETAATFAQRASTDPARRDTTDSVLERRVLAMLIDVPGVGKGKPGTLDQRQHGFRLMRGVIEAIASGLIGNDRLTFMPGGAPGLAAIDPAGSAIVALDGRSLGWIGLIEAGALRAAGLDAPVVAAELELAPLVANHPPRGRIVPLPAFPGIERDLSVIVADEVRWTSLTDSIDAARPALLTGVRFVGTYRGKPVEPGKKSVTLRMTFRDPSRTLRDDEVTPQVGVVLARLAADHGAVVRA